ncbi:MAG: hypothetical protein V5A28_14995 [Haloarculaceae archaeon]
MSDSITPVGDLVLQGTDTLLELEQILLGAQFGVVLHARTERPKRLPDLLVGRGFLGGRRGAFGLLAGLDEVRQDLPFVVHVLFGGVDEFGEFVLALFQDDVDVLSGLVGPVVQVDELVVDVDRVGDAYHD